MAICRLSDYQCDLYIYESDAGIACHVGARRYVDEPEPPSITELIDGDIEKWTRQYAAYRQALEGCEREPIGLSHDGEFRIFETWRDLLTHVIELRVLGYQVPDWVTEEIRREAVHEGQG